MADVVEVTDATFRTVVLESPRPVLVDYWADWCAPCRQLSPIIEELAAEHGDKVTFTRLDTNANPVTPTEQQVLGLPTLQIYVGGTLVKQFRGSKTKSQLLKALDDYL
ncbi:thiol reductase thioredoxin [Desertihabitans brevis]|uniref:Thioredoxin n=1 Tax=Desertihabitans brevis TaxID=2268447 RepID=A0A367YXB9_9ACTN|nr:thioredoxin domain-containing protein [Desertihabitans brevis]RCK70377.1 thiol reductase thioredoxin [Desertihabitans brevis]